MQPTQPEGNLFKDRFLALQKRALIEPRVPQLYVASRFLALSCHATRLLTPLRPKRKARKLKEYEKHAYKRFE
jgi:nucleolar protein 53